jgi:sterol desaturase/sphingolipid hydroxylase (fatty acid hydroxylase superfamily)
VFDDPQVIEIATLLALMVVFEVFERRRPARRIDRLAPLRIDALCFVFALLVNRISTRTVLGTIDALGPSPLVDTLAALRALPSALRILLALVVVDFLLYWMHRAQHRWGWLWHTHAFHHTVRELYWFSGFRTSFLHSLLYNLPQTAVPLLVFGLTPLETGIAYAIGVLVQFVEHTNVRLEVGWLRFAFITPQYHRIHHAQSAFHNRNFAFVFPIWDRLFATQVDPERVGEDFALGLGPSDQTGRAPRMLIGV